MKNCFQDMVGDSQSSAVGRAVDVWGKQQGGPILIVCEHASNRIPAPYGNLGLPDKLRESHIAWDPGALGMAKRMADRLQAPLVAGAVSRLVYDCNRPPEAPDAVPSVSIPTINPSPTPGKLEDQLTISFIPIG